MPDGAETPPPLGATPIRGGRDHSRNDASRRRARLTSYAVMSLAAAAMIASIAQLWSEWGIWVSQAAIEEQTLRLDRRDERAAPDMIAIDAAAPPRRLVHDALYLARETAYARSPREKRMMLDRAAAAIDAAIESRPLWGEAWTVRAYIDATKFGPEARATLDDLAHSYADTPYLPGAAPWRVRTGFAGWDALSDATRRRLIDEAVWLARNDFNASDTVFDLARSSPGYLPFAIEWRNLRQNDADLVAYRNRARQ